MIVAVPAAPPGAVAVIVTVPVVTAVTNPVASTVATDKSLLHHANLTPLMAVPSASRAAATSRTVSPIAVRECALGVTTTDAPRTPRRTVS